MTALRVATFNIRHGEGVDGVVDLPRVASVLRALGASVIALQELDENLARSGVVDQPRELHRLTGLQVHFWPTIERDGGAYGLALATDEPIEARFHHLPRLENEEPRAAISGRIHGWSVVAAHLTGRARARRVQMAALAELVAELPGPLVVLGDLNSSRLGIGPLRKAGLGPAPGYRRTTRRLWRAEIDHVLAGRGGKVLRAWKVESDASDHFPVVAEIDAS